MGAGRPTKAINHKDLVSLTIRMTPAVTELVDELAKSGFFGQERRDVVEQLLAERLRAMFDWEEFGKLRARRRP